MIGTIAVGLRRSSRLPARVAVVVVATIVAAEAQPPSAGEVLVPGSSLEKPGDIGVRPHTNTLIFVPNASETPVGAPEAASGAARHHRKKSAGAINSR